MGQGTAETAVDLGGFDGVLAWITALAAVAAALNTYRNLRISQRSYQQSLDQGRVAQARQVWANPTGRFGVKAGGSATAAHDRHDLLGVPYGTFVFGDRPDDYTRGVDQDGVVGSIHSAATTYVGVKLHNASDAPIGRLSVKVEIPRRMWDRSGVRREGPRWLEGRTRPDDLKRLGPNSERYAVLKLRGSNTELEPGRTKVTVYFTDSAGLRWSRTGVLAPQHHPPRQPPRHPRLQAWKNRRVMQLRKVRALLPGRRGAD